MSQFLDFSESKHKSELLSLNLRSPTFGQDMPLMDDPSSGPVFASPWRLAGTLETGDLCVCVCVAETGVEGL